LKIKFLKIFKLTNTVSHRTANFSIHNHGMRGLPVSTLATWNTANIKQQLLKTGHGTKSIGTWGQIFHKKSMIFLKKNKKSILSSKKD
jgi:hypothetical protein